MSSRSISKPATCTLLSVASLTIMVGGEPAVFVRVQPLFALMG